MKHFPVVRVKTTLSDMFYICELIDGTYFVYLFVIALFIINFVIILQLTVSY